MRGWIGAVVWMVAGGAVAAGAAFVLLGGAKLPALGEGAPLMAVSEAPRRQCPPPLSTPGRNPAMPPDDIFGIRPGQTVAEAQALILCRSERFNFQFEPVWHSPQTKPGQAQRQLMQARRPGEMIVVALAGPLGQERVLAIWRDESFPLATAPTIDSLRAELGAQFGAPHGERNADFTHLLSWSFSPDGRPMAESRPKPQGFFAQMQGMFARDQSVEGCLRNAKLTWLETPSWSEACGVTAQASIDGQLDDPKKASRIRQVVMDQAALSRSVAGYRRQVTPP